MKIKKNKLWHSIQFVRPLYKKIRLGNKVTNVLSSNVGTKVKLEGNALPVKRNIGHVYNRRVLIKRKTTNCFNLPGVREKVHKSDCTNSVKSLNKKDKMFIDLVTNLQVNDPLGVDKRDKIVQINGGDVHINRNEWLRVYPAPQLLGESNCSVVIRCLVCQLGLVAFLLLWTVVWTFTICFFEEPNERDVSKEFRKKQTQLIIDLATELRQITPLSSKWRQAIEKRIERERHLTETAIGLGARHDPGRFWDLSGTFLFNVYIMTAMGFGAPVPHTVYGRTSAIVYAAVAIPTHVFLMVNASQCIVVNFEKIFRKLKSQSESGKTPTGKSSQQFQNDRPTSTSDIKIKPKLGRFFKVCQNVVTYGQGIFIAIIGYYLIGALIFGYARGNHASDIIMFPMQFTTTGGLELIDGYTRVAYGLYIEGAMLLITCALAILRMHSSDNISNFSRKHRLYDYDPLLHSEEGV